MDEEAVVVDEEAKEEKVTLTGASVLLKSEKTDDQISLKEHQTSLTYTVPAKDKLKPEQQHMAGKKVEKNFAFPQVVNADEANQVMEIKGLSVVDYVNDYLKSNARSSCYQSTAALYKESKLSAEEILERSVRDMIRGGIPEDIARAAMEGAKASVKAQQ